MSGWAALLALPPLLVAALLVTGGTLAAQSGWHELAERYRAERRPVGKVLWGEVWCVGMAWTRRNTGMIAAEDGLYLCARAFERAGRPPLLVPWREVRHALSLRNALGHFAVLDLGGRGSVHVGPAGLAAVRPHLIAAGDAAEAACYDERGARG